MAVGRYRAAGAALFLAAGAASLAAPPPGPEAGLRFSIRFGPEHGTAPLDGRLLVLVSTDGSQDPRYQISEGLGSQQAFGIDVEGLRPGQAAVLDATTLGYPRERMADIPAGTYTVQALLHRY